VMVNLHKFYICNWTCEFLDQSDYVIWKNKKVYLFLTYKITSISERFLFRKYCSSKLMAQKWVIHR
jgi:hypothetical protein